MKVLNADGKGCRAGKVSHWGSSKVREKGRRWHRGGGAGRRRSPVGSLCLLLEVKGEVASENKRAQQIVRE